MKQTLKIKRNQHLAVDFLSRCQWAVGKLAGVSMRLSGFDYGPDGRLVMRFCMRLPTVKLVGDGEVRTFQVYSIADLKYELRHLRRMCL